jgi:hypothetical protein
MLPSDIVDLKGNKNKNVRCFFFAIYLTALKYASLFSKFHTPIDIALEMISK